MIKRPILSRRFVGRSAELAHLLGMADSARGAALQSVVISGEAGLGKSRLLREFESQPQVKPLCVVRDGCFDYARAPYAPIENLIRKLDAAEPKVLGRDAALRASVLHFFAPGERDPSLEATGYRKRKAFDALVDLIGRYSAMRPTVLVIEDLHWSDLGTLEILEHIAQTFAGRQLMLVLTMRPDSDLRVEIEAFLAKFTRQPNLSTIALEGLDDASSLELIESALDGAEALTNFQRQQIIRLSGGNPLYIEELLKSLVDNPRLADVPRNIQVAVGARLREFTGPQFHLLRLAAILVQFSRDMLAQLTGQELDEVSALIGKAKTLNLLQAPDADIYYSFRHELLRRAVLQDMPAEEYRSLHRAVAEYYEAQADSDQFIEQIALHWWEGGESERAQRYNRAAGDRAFKKYAFADAIVYYERAAASSDADGEVYRLLAKAYHHTSQLSACVEALQKAFALFSEAKMWQQRVEVLLELSQEHYRVLDFEQSLETLQAAIADSERFESGRLRFAVRAWESWYRAHREPSVDGAIAAANRADSFRDEADASSVALLEEARAYTHWRRGDKVQWRLAAERAVAAAKMTGDPFLIVHHLSDYASRATLINAPFAIELYDEAISLAQAKGLGGAVPYTLAALAHTQLTGGDISGAASNARRVLMTAHDFPFVKVVAAFVAISAAYERRDEGLLQLALNPVWLQTALKNMALYGQLLRAHAEVDMAGGNAAAAVSRLREIVGSLERAEFNERALVLVAEWGVSDLAGRAEALLRESAKGERHGYALLSMFLAISSSGPERVRHASDARELFREMGWPLDEARSLELLGKADQALALYERCGALASVARVAAQCGRRAPRFELTRREKEIADMVATGKSNKTIAQELVLSNRTVENHLTAIYSKLGLKSRTELVAQWRS